MLYYAVSLSVFVILHDASVDVLCSQALKVLRSAEYAPYVVFIAAPSARDLQLAKTTGIDVSLLDYSIVFARHAVFL